MKIKLLQSLLAVPLITVIVGGCALYEAYRPVVMQVPQKESLVSLDLGEPPAEPPVFITRSDRSERQDYALFKGSDVQAELIYVTVIDDEVALSYPYAIESMIGTWQMNRGRPRTWGATSSISTRDGPLFYKRYTLAEHARDCVGFSREWDDPADDPDHRPGKVLFGYACAAPGATLSDERISALLHSIRTKKAPKSQPVAAPGASEERALALVRGDAHSERGNVAFPFDFARHYIVDSDHEKKAQMMD